MRHADQQWEAITSEGPQARGGNTGQVFIVSVYRTKDREQWACSCPGGIYRRECRHIMFARMGKIQARGTLLDRGFLLREIDPLARLILLTRTKAERKAS
jgi:hypothetical protein